MNELHLFAGAGGGILAGQLLGHRCVCAVEYEPYAQAVLVARQNDGTFPPFPIWDDVRTFDGRPWCGVVDVVAGGFPCQDISAAGNGNGIDGERSGLWREMARIVSEVRPRYVFVENSPLLVGRGLAVVLGDLADMGYDAQWFRLSASDCGAPHQRDRCWLVAHSDCLRELQPQGRECDQRRRAGDCGDATDLANAKLHRLSVGRRACDIGEIREGRVGVSSDVAPCLQQQADEVLAHSHSHSHSQQRMVAESQPRNDGRQAGLLGGAGIFPAWPADPADAPESRVGRVVDGMAHRAHRIKALGNGQVSRVAAAAFAALSGS
ncbi:MAG: DNA cytosine methyltransferase [Phycisphaerae bacterium]|nr:DNA cytosine methyltransferase [Phycisphaerae bacterium]